MQNKISYGHAKALVGLDISEQQKITDSIVGQKLSVRDVEEMATKLKSDAKKTEKTAYNEKKLKLSNLVDALDLIDGLRVRKTHSSITIFFENQTQIDKISASLTRE